MPALLDEELTARLRRFDPHTDISMVRTSPMNDSEWRNARRVWVVALRPAPSGATPSCEMVRHTHPSLAEAVRLAVEEGERRGWAR